MSCTYLYGHRYYRLRNHRLRLYYLWYGYAPSGRVRYCDISLVWTVDPSPFWLREERAEGSRVQTNISPGRRTSELVHSHDSVTMAAFRGIVRSCQHELCYSVTPTTGTRAAHPLIVPHPHGLPLVVPHCAGNLYTKMKYHP